MNETKMNQLDLKDKDFEQQCLRNILARTTSLAMMTEPGDIDELSRYSSIAMALSSCSKSLENNNEDIYSSLSNLFLSKECDGDCEHCELTCCDLDDLDDLE